jgi:glutathione peroxidase
MEDQQINPMEIPTVEYYDESVYDLNLESLDGEDNIFEKNKGKVTMLVNVTGECANSPQYVTIQNLYDKYKYLG